MLLQALQGTALPEAKLASHKQDRRGLQVPFPATPGFFS